MKDLSGFRAPNISIAKSRDEADKFYSKYGKGQVPVDIEDIIEFDLNIEIHPKQNLYSLCKSDAFLANSCKEIFVDADHYGRVNNHPYVRFSLAHEIGHLILHSSIVPTIRPTSIDEWKNIVNTIQESEYNKLELPAYEFAGRLLVPRNVLIEELKAQITQIKVIYDAFPDIEDDTVIDQTAVPICKRFNVSDNVISRRIRFEKIWDLVKPTK